MSSNSIDTNNFKSSCLFHGSLMSSPFLFPPPPFLFVCLFWLLFVFQKDPVNSLENLEEKKFAGEASIPSPKPKLHSRDLKKELIT